MTNQLDRPEIAEALEAAQHRNGGYLTQDAMRRVAAELAVPLHHVHGVATFFPHFRVEAPARHEVRVCVDLSCRLRGGATFLDDLATLAGTLPAGEIAVMPVSCLGRCDGAPAVSVDDVSYWRLDRDGRDRLVGALRTGTALPVPVAPVPVAAAHADPYPSGTPRYAALRRLAVSGDAASVLATLKAAQLRGMGGAGFPAAVKWEAVRNAVADEKYIVCNADESEPGTIKDRGILTTAPHLLVEGMAIAGLVTGARRGIVYIRHEYAPETVILRQAIADAYIEGVLGASVAGSRQVFDLEVFVSPGGYICGEETALLEALEGRRAQPRLKPPLPVFVGLHGKPTVINNVETLAHVPAILAHGSEWYVGKGRAGAAGFKFVGISGDVERPGVYEVPFGTTFRELIDGPAGGMSGGRVLKAIVPSGASSGFLPARLVDTPMEWGALAKAGSMVGSSAVVAVAEGRCMVDLALNVARFFARESCGKCWPCRVGSEKLVHILEDVTRGQGDGARLGTLDDLALTLRQTSICGLGQVVPAPIASVLAHFPDEVAAHVRDRRCPSGTCTMTGANG
ncbi:MAG TPA: NADH-ubiquinone oxidoreductase-F iron-sulfur binding region domain-containing protein [Candidatus Binatia bacterium]|jgi:NADH:ubiquinone oxidoreductase subunit F (NADH-binding)/NADH:ubiquinone oxidoreductase subunit E|nr:NADH-ubiquinone oxidoreductase-F iron-sulfur binding region domain-containing protein [Candidatus Binatia bacterium]